MKKLAKHYAVFAVGFIIFTAGSIIISALKHWSSL